MRRAKRLLLATLMLLAGAPLASGAATPRAPAAISMASHFFRTSDGVRLHVLETSPKVATDPVLVLLTGWSLPASLWRDQLSTLGRRHQLLALDPRGQGRSEVPAQGYDIDRRAEDIHELLVRRIPKRPVVLVGWSLGALEALQYLHRHGDGRLAGLVLVDSSVGEGPAPGGPSKFPEELRRNRRQAVADFIKAIFKTPRPAGEIRVLTDSALRMPLEASLSLFPSQVTREHWRQLARGFAKPLLYVVTPQFAEQARELATNRAGTRTEVFAKAGHALFVDEPARFNRLLEEFVARTAEWNAAGS